MLISAFRQLLSPAAKSEPVGRLGEREVSDHLYGRLFAATGAATPITDLGSNGAAGGDTGQDRRRPVQPAHERSRNRE